MLANTAVDPRVCSGCGSQSTYHDPSCPLLLAAGVLPKRTSVDQVNHPPHYKQGSVECIDAIKAALTEEEFRGYCKGNIIKYTWRERHKGGDESLEKARWYLGRLV